MKGKGSGNVVEISNATVTNEIISEFLLSESNAIFEVGYLKAKKIMQLA